MPLVRTLDFTNSLPQGCTFSRGSPRYAVQNGVLTELPPNIPAFESTGSSKLGISIQQASSNIADIVTPQINSFTVTPSANSLTGLMDAEVIAEDGVSNTFQRINRIIPDLPAGVRFCFSLYVASDEGFEDSLFGLVMTNRYNNGGVTATFRNDGIDGVSIIKDDTLYADSQVGFEKVNEEFTRYWISGVRQSEGQGSFEIRSLDWVSTSPNTSPNPNHKIKIFGAQLELHTYRPSSYMPVSDVLGDNLQISDIAGLNTTEGTIVIEHDVRSGSLLSVSGNSILDATIPGKTAIAWSGSDSSICHNESPIVNGPLFSVSSPVDLLEGTTGHIKSIRVYDERLSDEDLRNITAKENKAKRSVYRIASENNEVPVSIYTPNEGYIQYTRFPFKITHDCSEIKLTFNNWKATLQGDDLGTEVLVHKCALEYNGVFVPVTFNGQESLILDAGASDIQSDALPEILAGTEGFIRVQMSGERVPACRSRFEPNAEAYFFNPEDTVVPDVYDTGVIQPLSGGRLFQPLGFTPIIIGLASDTETDPVAIFVVGDSLIGGTNDLIVDGTFMNKAAVATNSPMLLHAVGGEHHYHRDASERWRDSLKYCRVLFDNMYANNGRGMYGTVHSIYNSAREHGIEDIYRIETFPFGQSNDNWATNQTNIRPKPNEGDVNATEWLESGYIDGILPSTGIIDEVTGGWVMNGTDFYMTPDGTHQSLIADNTVAANAIDFINNLRISQPLPPNASLAITLPEHPINRSQKENDDGIIIGVQYKITYDIKLNVKED